MGRERDRRRGVRRRGRATSGKKRDGENIFSSDSLSCIGFTKVHSKMSWEGEITGLFVAETAGAPMQSVEAVRAVPGRGLEGDRYFRGEGAFSRWDAPRREVTLIDADALVAAARESGVDVSAQQSRRNVLTRGAPLNELVRTEFAVGEVRLRGIRLCQPCMRLIRLLGHDDTPRGRALLRALVDRGGLRARILSEGSLHVGDPVRPVPGASPRRLP